MQLVQLLDNLIYLSDIRDNELASAETSELRPSHGQLYVRNDHI